MPVNKDCSQCKGQGFVADIASYPKPAWSDFENRPRGGPDPMTDFVQPCPCPTCFPSVEEQVAKLRQDKEAAVLDQEFEKAARIREQIDKLQPPKSAPCEVIQLTFAKLLRSKALGYKQKAETLGGLADVAEKLEPHSAAETAFIEFVKTQGVEL